MSHAGPLQGPGQPPPATPPPPPPPPSQSPLQQPRRSRAVACAECRRLKLKCDRAFPCMNCRRREVANLCPNGSLITRSRVSNSAIPDGTEKKHDAKWMMDRIRRLEEALALVQSKVSNEPHPLLSAAPPPPPPPPPPPSTTTRPDEYASGSSEQPENEPFTPPSTSHPRGSKRIFFTEDALSGDKPRPPPRTDPPDL